MLTRCFIAATLLALAGQFPVQSFAQDVRYYEKDGITYQETRQTVQRVVPETRLEQRDSITYRPQYTTDMKETQRAYVAPVTEYQWVPYVERTWNPFANPVLTYRYVPQTRWEPRVETVRYPQTRCDIIPEKHTVQVPVTTSRIAEEQVVRSVPIGVTPKTTATVSNSSNPTPVARAERVGGLHQFESDPPRQTSNPGAADAPVQR